MEVSVGIPGLLLAFCFILTVISCIGVGVCFHRAHRAEMDDTPMAGYVSGGVICVLSACIIGGHFIYLLNKVVCSLGSHI